MRILFMGTPDFAEASLKHLYDIGHDICGVFTKPDKPKNRGMKLEFSPVKKVALEHDTPVFQPTTLRDGSALQIISELEPELIAVVAYGKILPKEILDYPKYGCINIHGSILPTYRGSAPIQWTVLNGDKEAGVTSMYMGVEMDAGDIIDIKKTEVRPNETSGELFDRLMVLGADLLGETIEKIEKGTAVRTPQDHSKATFAPMITKELCPIDFNESADKILNKIFGLLPWPVATITLGDNTFKIYDAKIGSYSGDKNNGEVISAGNNGLEIACSGGSIVITQLQAPGGKRMNAADYFRGHKL